MILSHMPICYDFIEYLISSFILPSYLNVYNKDWKQLGNIKQTGINCDKYVVLVTCFPINFKNIMLTQYQETGLLFDETWQET